MPQFFKGYIRLWNNERRIWEYEHRKVMENKLGRKLLSTETVHHLNGVKTDNYPKNLVILTHQEHERVHQNGKKNRRHTHCTINTCNSIHHAKGLCNAHYMKKIRSLKNFS